MAIYLSEDIKHLLNDIEKFCNKYFAPGTFNRHMDKSKSKKADICLSTKFTDQTPNLCIVSLITERDTNNIYSNEAAKALCDLLIKWGRLKDNAEITKGSLIIPYDGVVHLNFEVFAVEPPEEHDQLVATIPASIKYGPPVSCKYCAFHSSASLEYPCCSCEDHSFFVFDTKKSEECPTKERRFTLDDKAICENCTKVTSLPYSYYKNLICWCCGTKFPSVVVTPLAEFEHEVLGKIVTELLSLRSEINCRWEHGAEGKEHLQYVEDRLGKIIRLTENQEPK